LHDLFQQLSGNPLAILMMASIHKVKTERGSLLMKQKGPNSNEPKCNLQVIYELVKEEVAFVDDDL